MHNNYFRLTDETKINKHGVTLHRIECLVEIPSKGLKPGNKGGWVEKESNLCGFSAWVYDDAEVFGNAVVNGDAEIRNTARVYQDARVVKGSKIMDKAKIFGYAYVDAEVAGKAEISGHAHLCGCRIAGNAEATGHVYGGEWLFSPFNIQGSVHSVCETRPGFLKIGCLDEAPIEELYKNRVFIARENKYTEPQLQEYLMIVQLYEKILQTRENGITNPF